MDDSWIGVRGGITRTVGADETRKIDEPKTPYVWYDAKNDDGESLSRCAILVLADILEIPGFDLRGDGPRSPTTPLSPTSRSSISASSPGSSTDRRPTMTSSSRSGSSSRSASFSLPTKDKPVRPGGHSPRSGTPSSDSGSSNKDVISPHPEGLGLDVTPGIPLGATSANTAANSGEVFGDDDTDEEMDEEAKRKHKEFKGKRKNHYAMEAKLALARAKQLMDEDEKQGAGQEDGDMDVDRPERVNGS